MLGLAPIAGAPIAAFKSNGAAMLDVFADYVRLKKKRQPAEESRQPAHLLEQVLRKKRQEEERKKAAVAEEIALLMAPEAQALPIEAAPRVWTDAEIAQDDEDVLALILAEEEAMRNAFMSTLRFLR